MTVYKTKADICMEYIAAYDEGKRFASAIKPGDLFLGAMSEASKRYETGSHQARGFVNGYLDGLPANGIVTNSRGIVLEPAQ